MFYQNVKCVILSKAKLYPCPHGEFWISVRQEEKDEKFHQNQNCIPISRVSLGNQWERGRGLFMAFNQNLKEYFHQNQNSIPTPMVSLGYLWENRRGVYSILPKSEGEFSSMFSCQSQNYA